eukprot:scaffold114214_cov30-Tisochrysis_lutea.AAC.2
MGRQGPAWARSFLCRCQHVTNAVYGCVSTEVQERHHLIMCAAASACICPTAPTLKRFVWGVWYTPLTTACI